MKCNYMDDEGDLCALNMLTLADWMQKHPDGLLKIHASLATPAEVARYTEVGKSRQEANVPRDAAQRDDAEGLDVGMVINGTNRHDNQGAVFGSEGSRIETRVNDEERTRMNQSAGLVVGAAGQTRHKSST